MILGCTHYPLVAPMLQRMLGRGVTLVTSGAGVARSVERRADAARAAQPAAGEGDLPLPVHRRRRVVPRARHALSADAARRGDHVELGTAGRGVSDRAAPRAQLRPRCRPAAPGDDRAADFVRTATGSALISMGETRVICTASVAGERAALAGRLGPRLGHGRVRDAPRLDRRAQAARRQQGPARRAHGRDPAADRPLAARRGRLRGARRAHDLRRLRRPPGRRRHPLRLDHRRDGRAAARLRPSDRAGLARAHAADRHRRRRLVRDRRRRSRCSTSTTPRTRPPRSTPTS